MSFPCFQKGTVGRGDKAEHHLPSSLVAGRELSSQRSCCLAAACALVGCCCSMGMLMWQVMLEGKRQKVPEKRQQSKHCEDSQFVYFTGPLHSCLREKCSGGPPGMARQPGAWRQHGKEDLGDERKQCASAPRSWYVCKADVLPWCAWQ